MNDMAEPMKDKERHAIEKMTLNSGKVKGLEDFVVDDEVEVRLKVRVLKPMGHGSTWDKEDLKRPLEGEYEILSGKAVSVQDDIDDAKSLKELNNAVGLKED
jgi:hypothetical protein